MNRKTLHGARLCVRSLFLIAALALVALAVACSAAEQPPVAVASETAKAPATRPAKADPADWCKGHGVPESMCTRCNPELVEPFKKSGDWCAEHGYPESVCPTCNPMDPPKPAGEAAAAPSMQVAAADPSDWCKGHSVPESKCTICNPELIPKFKEAGDWCEEHGLPESVCPQCTTKPVTSAIEPGTRVRFKSAQIESAAGIETVAARTLELGDEIACVGRVEYDGNRYADVRSTTAGIVRRVHVSPGDRVRRGQALFELESVDVGDAQGRLATARERFETDRARHERLETLHARQMVSDEERDRSAQRLAAAGAEMRSAESALRITGAPASRHDGRFVLRAPIDGIVVARDAVLGTLATEETRLAAVADPSRLWVMLEIAESDAARVAPGAATQILGERETGRAEGALSWIASHVNERTRMVEARIELDNKNGAFRAGQFVTAHLEAGARSAAVAVPRGAVQRVGAENVVFVRTSPGTYEPRSVRVGRSHESLVEIDGPVGDDDEVVTVGAFLLKTEISKENIGAGCCEIETGKS